MNELVKSASAWLTRILEVGRPILDAHGVDRTRERYGFAVAVSALSELYLRGSARPNAREIETVAAMFAHSMARDAAERGANTDYVDPPFLPLTGLADWARFRDLLGDTAELLDDIETELLNAPDDESNPNLEAEITQRLVVVEALRARIADMFGGPVSPKLGTH